jgi:hypothetical protein
MIPIFPLPPSGPRRLDFTIREITGAWDRRRFVRFAARVYRGDRYWAPGILSERTRALDPRKNPALAHTPPALFMAESRTLDEPVGAIAVWFDSRGASGSGRKIGRFGLFEAVNEGEVIASLLESAETWLQQHLPDAGGLRGPMELDPCRSPGLLVDAYNLKPAVLMPYNPPYYAELIEDAGYEPGPEHLAYRIDLAALRDPSGPEAIRLRAEARPAEDGSDLDVREIGGESGWQRIVSAAQQGPAGATWSLGPETPTAIQPELAYYLKQITGRRPSTITLAVRAGEEGEPLAFGMAVPNHHEAALVSFVKRLKRMCPDGRERRAAAGMVSRRAGKAGIRLLPPIVRSDCRGFEIERLLISGLLIRAAQRGYATAEVSPVPADDTAAYRRTAECRAIPYKTYRIYEKRF